MFESASHNLTSSPERAYLDFLLGKDFERLYKEELPECLRDNRHCAIYLVDSLKTIFEAWFADAVIDLKSKTYNLTASQVMKSKLFMSTAMNAL